MIRRPPRSTLFPYTSSSDLAQGRRPVQFRLAAADVDQDRIAAGRSEEHTSELQSLTNLVCRLLLEKKKKRMVALHCRSCRAADSIRHLLSSVRTTPHARTIA